MSEVHTTSSQNDLGTEESQEDSDLRYAEVKLERKTNFEEQESKQHFQEPVTELNLEESTIQTDSNETLGFQEWSDGSSYRGNVSMNLKLGSGQFKWVNGESYSGEFYNDHHHGKGIYTWPDGSKFLGSFYLSRREGFGTMMFNDNRTFQGLYKSDVRYGPGIETNNDGSQDVGIWLRNHLIKLCTSVRCSFSISSYPEFYQQSNETLCKNKDLHGQASEKGQREDPFLYSYKILLQEDSYTLPEKIYFYSSDIDHLPITPSARTEIDTHFYKDIDQPGHLGDLVSCEMQDTDEMKGIHLHVYKHRNSQEYLEWSIGSIMSAVRQKFGPRGSREQFAEKFIEMAGLGDYETVFMILRHDLAHVDVSDSCAHTALHSATVNSHDNIINLLLDNGADINKRNDEGISALSMCFILLYGTQSFRPNVAERNLNLCKGGSGDVALHSKEYLNDAFAKDDGPFNGLGEDMNRSITLSDHCHSDHRPNTKVPENVLCQTSTIYNSQEKLGTGSDRTPPVSEPKDTERRATLNLLLYRGADPNMCSIPMYALFFAVKAADITTVRLLLERGAHTDVRLATEHGALTPLHIAAAIPGIEGVKITELLLHAAADPNIRVENDDYIFEHDKVTLFGVVFV
ncbi:ankyrin repeat and MYND domain-containing protein 1-like [Bombina bombina]|uniref:ankyrin repeat and MYND domain-containing protein 1-like n=1 Tax=Bombina bombina TaxID=8345 RepID=UPI00235B0A15|nr:ankyrin repeat and MYND domain-containing protein 1-like [Bombina bombina]